MTTKEQMFCGGTPPHRSHEFRGKFCPGTPPDGVDHVWLDSLRLAREQGYKLGYQDAQLDARISDEQDRTLLGVVLDRAIWKQHGDHSGMTDDPSDCDICRLSDLGKAVAKWGTHARVR